MIQAAELRITLLLFLIGATPVAAQDVRLSQRFPPPVAARLNAAVDSAGHEGLPTEPLLLRALEGQAKNASTDQIIAALERLRNALRTSRSTLGGGASQNELTVAAAALQAGVPQRRLAELHELRGNMSVTAPLGAYLDLIARGARADRTWVRISDLARRRANDADYGRLTPADVEGDVAPARPPGPPVEERSR